MFKECFVPSCSNTSANSCKIFLYVPKDEKRRQEWFKTVNKNVFLKTGTLYCCEDHFDLENDAKNWMFYKTIGTKLYLKPNVVPHLNLKRHEKIFQASQISIENKRLKIKNMALLKENTKSMDPCVPVSSSATIICPMDNIRNIYKQKLSKSPNLPSNQLIMKNIATQTDVSVRTFKTQTDAPEVRSKITRRTKENKYVEQSSPSSSHKSSETSEEFSPHSSNGIEDVQLNDQAKVFLIETNSRFYLELPSNVYNIVEYIPE